MEKKMLFAREKQRLNRFNKYCLHYNLVAQAAYEQLKTGVEPFSKEYRPFIIAALISFDMGRMMGAGVEQKYNPDQGGFASKLDNKMKAIQSDIEPLCTMSIANAEIEGVSKLIKKNYATLAEKGVDGLHSGGKEFHVGATKILHFINPYLFPIVDSNASKTLRTLFGLPYKNSTQPGYSAELYVKSIIVIKKALSKYDFHKFQSLEPETPMMSIFDKLTFAQMVRYYGFYSNVARGKRKKNEQDKLIPSILEPDGSSGEYKRNWARLIQKIYEVDPLTCSKCSGKMKVISVIEDENVIKKILKHLGLWDQKARPPPKSNSPPIAPQYHIDYTDSQVPACDDYLFHDPEYPIESYAS
ncbi:MAG: hypothetical protein SV775_03970 [Thermodesulfobacteriota bacterium]|nr:hypothetical protein [Thermodesulfobacteriota bacterium]